MWEIVYLYKLNAYEKTMKKSNAIKELHISPCLFFNGNHH